MSKDWIDGKSNADILERSDILKKFYNGKAGEIFRAIVNGLITQNLTIARDNVSADRILGRCEAYQHIINLIEIAIEEGEELKRPLQADEV